MSCENCKSDMAEAAKAGRVMADMIQKYEKQNTRLWIIAIAQMVIIIVMAFCLYWGVQNAQEVANEAVLNALETVGEIEVIHEETTNTQTVEGDSATINNVDGEQYNDNAAKNGGVE